MRGSIQVNESKVEKIKSWLISIIALLTECIKKESFEWLKATQRAFKAIKEKLCSTPIWLFSTLNSLLKLEVMLILLALGQTLPKPSDHLLILVRSWVVLNLTTSLMTSSFILSCELSPIEITISSPSPFVIHSGHRAKSFINGQATLNSRHVKWVEFL